jgi:SAM-dependent methyltransferase
MDAASRRKLLRLYDDSLKRHGPTVQALRWTSTRSQQVRFEVLAEVGPWDGASVADIGCGLGDFYGFLRDRGHSIHYTGYDINPRMIEAARAKYPDPNAVFAVRDILEDGLGGEFDYVVASGTFNIRISDHDAFLRQILAVMYAGCRRAVAFNFLQPAPYSDWQGGDMYYDIAAEEVVAYCRTLCPNVTLHEGYLPFDATVYMEKARPGAPGSAS